MYGPNEVRKMCKGYAWGDVGVLSLTKHDILGTRYIYPRARAPN